MILINDKVEAIVVDASVAVAICAKEINKETQAQDVFQRYSQLGCRFFAPNLIVSETLYVLCKKVASGEITPEKHNQAINDFEKFLQLIESRPDGDYALMRRAEEIRGTYSCRRSADGLYIALAEQLSAIYETVILTFDEDMPKQAARHAPIVTVQLLPTSSNP